MIFSTLNENAGDHIAFAYIWYQTLSLQRGMYFSGIGHAENHGNFKLLETPNLQSSESSVIANFHICGQINGKET